MFDKVAFQGKKKKKMRQIHPDKIDASPPVAKASSLIGFLIGHVNVLVTRSGIYFTHSLAGHGKSTIIIQRRGRVKEPIIYQCVDLIEISIVFSQFIFCASKIFFFLFFYHLLLLVTVIYTSNTSYVFHTISYKCQEFSFSSLYIYICIKWGPLTKYSGAQPSAIKLTDKI